MQRIEGYGLRGYPTVARRPTLPVAEAAKIAGKRNRPSLCGGVPDGLTDEQLEVVLRDHAGPPPEVLARMNADYEVRKTPSKRRGRVVVGETACAADMRRRRLKRLDDATRIYRETGAHVRPEDL